MIISGITKKIYFILALALLTFPLLSQTNFNLKGEGKNDNVSVWVRIDKWDDNLSGYYIKRRNVDENGNYNEWKSLHKDMLIPGNEPDKSLSNVTNNNRLIKELEELRTTYLNNNQSGQTRINYITGEELKKQLKDPEVAQMVELLFAFDYNIALMYGFGYVDFNKPKSYAVEYGIFPVTNEDVSDIPVATYKWIVGTEVDLSIEIEKQSVKKRRKNVRLEWVFNKNSFDSNDNLAGFNIMRKQAGGSYERINQNIIWVNKGSKRRFVFFYDTIPSLEVSYSYALVPLSFFKSEGEMYELVLDTRIPDVIPPPNIKSDMPYGYDFIKNGAEIKWEFDSLYSDAISGFIVQRMDKPEDGFITVSDTIKVHDRYFVDKTIKQGSNSKFYYKVVGIQKESFPLISNRLTLYYDPYPEPSKPGILQAESNIENGTAVVSLSWPEDNELLSQIKGYQVRSDFGANYLASDQNIPLITDFKYKYEVKGVKGKKYLFSLFYIDKEGRGHPYTDTVEVIIPSESIPAIEFDGIEIIGSKIRLFWKYKDGIADLSGFRLYQNEVLIVDENEITAAQREWISPDLQPGKYVYTIQAISMFGLESRISRYKKTGVIEE